MLYKMPVAGLNNVVGNKSMPQLDFREALSSPEEKTVPSTLAPPVVTPDFLAVAAEGKELESRGAGTGLGRSGWTNVIFVTIASVGGLVCAFYFFNGAEVLRAAAAWPSEFLYSRPPALANIEISKQNSPDQSEPQSTGTPSSDDKTKAPLDRNFWPPTLSQPTTFAKVSSNGNVSGGSPFSPTNPSLTQLNTLQRGADALFQSFYQTAISMTPKTVTQTASRTIDATRKKISSVQQKVTAQANGIKSTAQSAQQTANSVQNQSMLNSQINSIRSQSQSLMGGGLGGLSHGGGMIGGVTGGLGGHH